MPSAFVDRGEMVSFPIPHNKKYPDPHLVRYDGVFAEGESLWERIRMLKGKSFASNLKFCHHDPDLQRGIFGQSGIAQAHLHQNVQKGDLFLFFGWFRKAEWNGEALRFCSPQQDVQALFGFLQIGESEKILPAEVAAQQYRHFCNHPHLTPARLKWDKSAAAQRSKKDSTVYISDKRLSIPGAEDLPGHGIFRHSPELVLTADGAKSRTIWKLPDIFRNREITYHSKESWRPDGLFQSRPRGQEFIVSDDEDENVSKWATNLIRRHYLHS